MPISCPSGIEPRYRYKKGSKMRLAFCGAKTIVEAKNIKTGATHSPSEFASDRKRSLKNRMTRGR